MAWRKRLNSYVLNARQWWCILTQRLLKARELFRCAFNFDGYTLAVVEHKASQFVA
ncbi:hypothetical protein KSX_07550 [Ktedonospora formicarum]|uniref:Transposase n=1 Tax=Ktedonospora formicarum TaxID=2778364 RepID=A0A8J3HXS7_9CHLR|nr:hypothetical protein KSX_07550 [Ktedonospora formicarum]